MNTREKEIKAALAVALRRVEAGHLTDEDFASIARLLEGVLPADDAAPSITTDAATPISISDAVSEIVRKRERSG
jgi:hypothetical protein